MPLLTPKIPKVLIFNLVLALTLALAIALTLVLLSLDPTANAFISGTGTQYDPYQITKNFPPKTILAFSETRTLLIC